MKRFLNFNFVLVLVLFSVIVCALSVHPANASQNPNFNPFDSGFHLRPLPSNSHNYVPNPQLSPPLGPGNVFPNDDKINGNASDRAKFVTNIVIPSRAGHRSPCQPGGHHWRHRWWWFGE